MCVAQKCMWGISQVKPSQAKSSQAKLLFVSRKISPTVAVKLQRESMSEWVSEWVRGSVTLNKILACFYSFSHTGYSTIDWLTINSAVLSLSLTLSLTLTLLLRKYCYSETINGNRWHKNYIDYGSHSINQSSHCKKKNATSLILIKTREMIWFNLIIGLKITTTSSSSVIILLGGGGGGGGFFPIYK